MEPNQSKIVHSCSPDMRNISLPLQKNFQPLTTFFYLAMIILRLLLTMRGKKNYGFTSIIGEGIMELSVMQSSFQMPGTCTPFLTIWFPAHLDHSFKISGAATEESLWLYLIVWHGKEPTLLIRWFRSK